VKIRLLIAVAGLAISFVLPTFAQQKDTPDPQLREAIVAIHKKYDDAFNQGDAVALATLYTEDAVEVTDTGLIYGREAIQKHYADVFQKVHFSNHLARTDEKLPYIIGADGNEMWAAGEWSSTIKGQNFGPIDAKGYWSAVFGRENGVWKKRWLTFNSSPAPAK
jgi:ketosteroid isomerase-like protein